MLQKFKRVIFSMKHFNMISDGQAHFVNCRITNFYTLCISHIVPSTEFCLHIEKTLLTTLNLLDYIQRRSILFINYLVLFAKLPSLEHRCALGHPCLFFRYLYRSCSDKLASIIPRRPSSWPTRSLNNSHHFNVNLFVLKFQNKFL